MDAAKVDNHRVIGSSALAGARVTWPVRGMSCTSCAARLERALAAVGRLQAPTVEFAREMASAELVSRAASTALFASAIVAAGFEVPPQTVHLRVSGTSCASCTQRIESALLESTGG